MAAQTVNWNVNGDRDVLPCFCALGFRFRDDDLLGRAPRTLMVVVLDPDGRLRVMVHPEIRNMFCGDDLEYIDAIVFDLVERGMIDPEGLIKHLCSVGGVGPLVLTHSGDSSADPHLTRLKAELVEV